MSHLRAWVHTVIAVCPTSEHGSSCFPQCSCSCVWHRSPVRRGGPAEGLVGPSQHGELRHHHQVHDPPIQRHPRQGPEGTLDAGVADNSNRNSNTNSDYSSHANNDNRNSNNNSNNDGLKVLHVRRCKNTQTNLHYITSLYLSLAFARTLTHTRVHTHARTHAHTHERTNARTNIHTHKKDIHTRAHNTHTPPPTHTNTRARAKVLKCLEQNNTVAACLDLVHVVDDRKNRSKLWCSPACQLSLNMKSSLPR